MILVITPQPRFGFSGSHWIQEQVSDQNSRSNRSQQCNQNTQDHPPQETGIILGLKLVPLIHPLDLGEQAPEKCADGQYQGRTCIDQAVRVPPIDQHCQQKNKDQFSARDPVDQVLHQLMNLRVRLGSTPGFEYAHAVGQLRIREKIQRRNIAGFQQDKEDDRRF